MTSLSSTQADLNHHSSATSKAAGSPPAAHNVHELQQEPARTLWLVDRLPAGGGLYVHYTHRILPADGWQSVDLRAFVERRHESWLDQLADWYERLTTHARSKWWWLLPASRLHIWHAPIRPLLFALGLLEIFGDRRAATICAVGCPAIVGRYVKELSGGAISVKGKSDALSMILLKLRRPLGRMRDVAVFLRQVRRRLNLPGSERRADLLVFSLGLSTEVLRERGDHFFGRVFDADRDRVQWLYDFGRPPANGDVMTELRKIGRRAIDSHLLTWREACEILRVAYRIRRTMRRALKGLPELRIDGASSRLFPREYFTELALAPLSLQELTLLFVTRRLLGDVRPRVVAYPYEEKGLERALIYACQEHDETVRTVGFAHAVHNPGLLYMREARAEARPPRPSVLAVTGKATQDWLRREGRADNVVVVGSPRVGSSAVPRAKSESKLLRVLLIVGFGYEPERLIDWLNLCPHLFVECEVKVRAYPYSWSEQQRAAMTRLRLCGVQSAQGTFEQQVGDADVVLSCATSAGVEAMLLGRVTVHVALHDLCPTNPYSGKVEGKVLLRCRNPEELKRLLLRLKAMPDSEYQSIVEEQGRIARRIYEPFRVDARSVFGLSDANAEPAGEPNRASSPTRQPDTGPMLR